MSEILPFQKIGAEWLANRCRALLADEMGIGKTIQLIHAADRVGAQRVAVISPALGRVNWRREFEKWAVYTPHLFVESYDKLTNDEDARAAFRAFRPDVGIIDEAHYLKNREALRTQMAYGQHCHNTGLMRDVPYVWLATGTPVLKDATDLWPHFRALWPHLIPGEDGPLGAMKFMERYTHFTADSYGLKVLGNKTDMLPEIRQALAQISMRRRSADVLPDLPPIFWNEYPIDAIAIDDQMATLEAHPDIVNLRRTVEAAIVDDTRSLWLDEDPIAIATLRRLTGITKAAPVAMLIGSELDAGAYDKIVVFCWHKEVLEAVARILARYGVATIRGGQSDGERQAQIDAFQIGPKRVAVVQIAAGYHTITLTAANQVAFIEKAWTPDINVQAAKRAHRYGQSLPVFVRSFGLVGSIDEAVTTVLVRRARTILEIME